MPFSKPRDQDKRDEGGIGSASTLLQRILWVDLARKVESFDNLQCAIFYVARHYAHAAAIR